MIELSLAGRSDYRSVHRLQRALVEARSADRIDDVLILVEHQPVITVGRARDAAQHVLAPGRTPVISVERGGDVTWHGPGQLVAYPIVKLLGERADLHRHLHSLEEAVIQLIRDRGLPAARDARNTGVWLPMPDGPPRKLCSIGIACRRWVSYHGLALNVDVELGAFRAIHPCGFDPGIMTRLADHLQPCPSTNELRQPLAAQLVRSLQVQPGPLLSAPALQAEQPLEPLLERISAVGTAGRPPAPEA